jgi:hypothetical protein
MNKLRAPLEEIRNARWRVTKSAIDEIQEIANNALQEYDEQWPSDEEIEAAYWKWYWTDRRPMGGDYQSIEWVIKWLKKRMRGENNE